MNTTIRAIVDAQKLLLVGAHLLAALKLVAGLDALHVGANDKFAQYGVEDQGAVAHYESGDGVANEADIAACGLDVAD